MIDKYLGVKFLHQGRDPEQGLDCYGFILCVYRDSGIDLFDLESYVPRWFLKGFDYFSENSTKQFYEVTDPRYMDIVLFQTSGIANHAGIVVDKRRFMHASRSGGVAIDKYTQRYWRQKIVGFYRHKND